MELRLALQILCFDGLYTESIRMITKFTDIVMYRLFSLVGKVASHFLFALMSSLTVPA